MSSEEKRTETRKEIMENESIFSPSKSTNSNPLSNSMNKSGKAQKIVEFKKVYNLINKLSTDIILLQKSYALFMKVNLCILDGCKKKAQ